MFTTLVFGFIAACLALGIIGDTEHFWTAKELCTRPRDRSSNYLRLTWEKLRGPLLSGSTANMLLLAGQPRYRASLNLNLRASPDIGSPNLLGPWSPDYIPQGTIFVGEPRCINEWCSITYQHGGVKTTGWVNGWYLEKLP